MCTIVKIFEEPKPNQKKEPNENKTWITVQLKATHTYDAVSYDDDLWALSIVQVSAHD